ncbi:MAG: MCE family protein [Solirubrobacterales bacterium]|nr:MCE family protein [Solirubrobacterales bacterium]
MRRVARRGPGGFAVGVAILVLGAVATYLAFSKEIPFRDHYTVRAVFKTANNLRVNSPVRVAGIDVGKVTGIERIERGGQSAVVEMRISDQGLPLHDDAELKIRPRIFLEGNFFVDVRPGSPSAPTVGDGDTIPINQTSAPVQLDQVLTALQDDTREDLKVLLAELSEGLDGEGGRGFNRSIEFWAPAYRDSAIVNDASLGRTGRDLSGYVEGAGAVAAALDRNATKLKSFITDFNTTARAFAVRDDELSAAIGELPRLLRTGRPALGELNDSLPPLRRFVADLRPGVRSSGPAIDATLPFARQLRGLVSRAELRGLTADLRPTVPALARLNRRTVPLYREVRQASSCQNEVILPWSVDKVEDRVFPAIGPVFQEQTRFLPGLAGESRSGDANGQWFRVLVGGGQYAYPEGTDRFFLTGSPIMGANPPKPAKRPPLRDDVPCETQQAPDLRTQAAPPPSGFRVNTTSDAARKLLAKAEKEALGWLKDRVKAEGLPSKLVKGGGR